KTNSVTLNDFFTFTQSKAKAFSIGENFLLLCICKAVDARTTFFTKQDFETLKQNNKKVYLFSAGQADNKFVLRYIQKGESEGIDKKYLTACRTPWYSIEQRPPSPIWVGVFNRTGLRFIRNEADVSNLTAFHCVYPQRNNLLFDIDIDSLFAYLLTNTAKKILTDNSREYGDGLQKFEPNDINKGMMLDLYQLQQSDKQEIVALYQHFRNSEQNELKYINKIDPILNNYFMR
ncbi:MAG: hypothetical protein LBE12_01990, partial [Planctomycetaceae bacterium]|nr:hypothetical protein [Planctomycetaceae bacterium]